MGKMIQLTINGEKITEKKRLETLRTEYYKQLVKELDILRIRKNQKIMSYRNNVREIDDKLKKYK